MLRILGVLVLLAGSTVCWQSDLSQEKEEKLADIRHLLEVSGAGRLAKQAADQMIVEFRSIYPQVPDSFWKEFSKELDPSELSELGVPSYDKYLTHDEIKQLIAFYDSPIGKKLIEVQPKMVQESLEAGRKWGQEKGRLVVEKLIQEGMLPEPGDGRKID